MRCEVARGKRSSQVEGGRSIEVVSGEAWRSGTGFSSGDERRAYRIGRSGVGSGRKSRSSFVGHLS